MSFTAGDLIKDVYAFWNRPAETDLSQGDVITILNRKINRLLLLAQVSDRNYLAVLSPAFTIDNMSTSINIDDLSSIVRVESRGIGSDDLNWSEEVIVDFGAWNDSMESRVDSVAFYGSTDDLTMVANRDVSSLEFRILYETGGVRLAAFNSTVAALQDFFRSTVFYGAAAEAGMMIDNLNSEAEGSRDKKVSFALAQEAQSVDDYKKWLLNEPGQAVSWRESFSSTREGTGQARMHADDTSGGYYSRW